MPQHFLDANKLQNLTKPKNRIKHCRQHDTQRRPHQSLHQATPRLAWETLVHSLATEPIPLMVLEDKAAECLRVRKLRQVELDKATIVVPMTGEIIDADILDEPTSELASNQMLVEVRREQRKDFYQEKHTSVPTTFAGRQFHRAVTEEELLLSDPDTTEVVLSFPLPLMALHARGKLIASYSIRESG
ncbi:hypothetical protein OK351_01655 [Glutamicibacter sp. MNS18]|uniref:hypothetical protein n=1 Tax=Glutamicibacter sp. MNS18 TaxID=2989817 RepID=UPI0022355ABD|nr:hypothetical protein [Glutamicibacter sp. MNS18]MCW4464215.1 hypothetical protein [Glutamicibacter sp. MNS18]